MEQSETTSITGTFTYLSVDKTVVRRYIPDAEWNTNEYASFRSIQPNDSVPVEETSTKHRKDKRIYFRCNQLIHGKYYCLHCVISKSYKNFAHIKHWSIFDTHQQKGNHLANLLNIKLEDRTVENATLITEEMLHKEAGKAWANLIGTYNISLNTATSEEVRDVNNKILLSTLAALTTFLKRRTSDAEELFNYESEIIAFKKAVQQSQSSFTKPYTREFIRKSIIEAASERFMIECAQFSSANYISLSIDAGTVRKRHFLQYIVHCAGTYIKPLPIFTQDMNSQFEQSKHSCYNIPQSPSDRNSYIHLLVSFLEKPFIQTLPTIAGITSDGFLPQVQAASPNNPNNFQHSDLLKNEIENNKVNNQTKCILHSTCACHKLHNSFKAAVLKNVFFQSITNSIKELSRLLRSPRCLKVMSAVCPEPVETRWLYSVVVVLWILNNETRIETIESILKKHLPYDFFVFAKLMEPFMVGIYTFSQDNYPLSYVWPIFCKIYDHLNNFASSEILHESRNYDKWIDAINDLRSEFQTRTIFSTEKHMWAAAFALSVDGFYQFKNEKDVVLDLVPCKPFCKLKVYSAIEEWDGKPLEKEPGPKKKRWQDLPNIKMATQSDGKKLTQTTLLSSFAVNKTPPRSMPIIELESESAKNDLSDSIENDSSDSNDNPGDVSNGIDDNEPDSEISADEFANQTDDLQDIVEIELKERHEKDPDAIVSEDVEFLQIDSKIDDNPFSPVSLYNSTETFFRTLSDWWKETPLDFSENVDKLVAVFDLIWCKSNLSIDKSLGSIYIWKSIQKHPHKYLYLLIDLPFANEHKNNLLLRLSDIALRLMSMVASETSCERLISTMRYVLPQRASRSSGDLVDAKIIMINTKFSVDHGVLKAKSKI